MIFLGKLPDMDPKEFIPGAEKASAVLGGTNFGSQTDPLSRRLVEVSAVDTNRDGIIRTDESLGPSESIRHDADGDGNISSYKVDSTFLVKNTAVTFRNPDGSFETLHLPVRIMQDSAGNTFLMPPPKGASAAEVEALTTRPIVSVSFPSQSKYYQLDYNAIFTDRHCFPCFARGTLIETEHGPLPVESLVPGMLVVTRDHGLQPLRWIGSRVLGSRALEASPNLRPIRIAAGALGKGLPQRDLIVSPQHRVLVRSKIAQKMFGTAEVLVAAKQLLQIDGIDIADDLTAVEYFHFLFDRHEIVLSEGAETESLYTGPEALKSVGREAQAEIFGLFPELRDRPEDQMPPGARLLASGRMGRKLAVRHAQHRKALLQ
ncbi:Hint domain-containing protein [Paracoccus sp. MKU1]|uniref:Hint domain-containing protein n=1 Tax=Paracoccus sp. MKU1 TaxID=1745182 RepID=UPI001EF04882|nr:Hint domain-containing protein [Paracoccus sp. MKU1]